MVWFMRAPLSPGNKDERQEGALFALAVFSGINLLNFVDRYVPGAIKELFGRDLGLTDVQSSMPMTGMIVVYIICAVIFGQCADKQMLDRRAILAFGVILWSVATALAGFSQNLWQLVLFRALVGVGEAAYSTVALPMIADFFPPKDRIKAYTIFNTMAPLGGAVGFILGGVVGSALGWRAAFFICGAPGLVLAFLVLLVNDPAPEQLDQQSAHADHTKSTLSEVKTICCNKHFWVATLGTTALVFTTGAWADWAATFLMRFKGASVQHAAVQIGTVTVVGGIVGNVLGSKAVMLVEYKVKSPYFLVPAIFQLPAAVFLFVTINLSHGFSAFIFLLLAEICVFTYTAPLCAATVNTMPVSLRARAFAVQSFITHLLGDLISPPIVGAISDSSQSLQFGMQITWLMPIVTTLIWYTGYTCLSRIPVQRDKSAEVESSALEASTGPSYGGASSGK